MPDSREIAARKRASKLLELTGLPYWDEEGFQPLNQRHFDNLEAALRWSAAKSKRVNPDFFSGDYLTDVLRDWDSVNPLLNAVMGPIVRGKIKRGLSEYSPEAISEINKGIEMRKRTIDPPINAERRRKEKALGIPFENEYYQKQVVPELQYLDGVSQRLPQIPTKLPGLVDTLRSASSIDNLPDLTKFLLPEKK